MNFKEKFNKYNKKYNKLIDIEKILESYKNKYSFNRIPVMEVKNHNVLYQYDNSGKLLPIIDIITSMYNVCFKSDLSKDYIKHVLFGNIYEYNDFYFLTENKKLLIFGFLTKKNNNFFLETVCKNFVFNYSKLCFNLILNIITSPENENRLIILEVDKNNNDAIDCYRKLGFSGKIVNKEETIEYSNRGYLIYYYYNGPNMKTENAKLLKDTPYKIIENHAGKLEFKIRKDITGNVKFIYDLI